MLKSLRWDFGTGGKSDVSFEDERKSSLDFKEDVGAVTQNHMKLDELWNGKIVIFCWTLL